MPSYNLGNVGAVNFNGASVGQINLNGSVIWVGGYSEQFTMGTRTFAGDDKMGAHTHDGLDLNKTTIMAGLLNPIGSEPPPYEGARIYMLMTHKWLNGQIAGSEMTIKMAGNLPKNFFNTLTINGRVFTSSSTTHHSYYHDAVAGQGSQPSGPNTTWRWTYFSGLETILHGSPTVKIS
tara:strand:- start:462 stop:995 length:534 start_codon:yes stop_codon:yes gene_type:complete